MLVLITWLVLNNMFKEKLKELLDEKQMYGSKLACEAHFGSKSTIYKWLRGEQLPKIDNAIKLRQYFNCSLDYLFGNASFEEAKGKIVSTFSTQLKKILKSKKITQQKLFEDLNLSSNNAKWHKLNSNLRMDTVIKIANYLNVSIDYLVGID